MFLGQQPRLYQDGGVCINEDNKDCTATTESCFLSRTRKIRKEEAN